MRPQGHGTKAKWRHSADKHDAGGSRPWAGRRARKGAKAKTPLLTKQELRRRATSQVAQERQERRAQIAIAIKAIAAKYKTWTGTPAEFRKWALSVARIVYRGEDSDFDKTCYMDLDEP